MQLRIGLNSGEVITGEIGSGPMTYTAVGEQVGMAQRMESVAPPGGVMVSDSTARLVDAVALLGETEQVHIKGATDPVPAHRLLGMATSRRSDRAEPTFVGRQWEMGALNGVLERSINGNGSIVGLVGPPGIGKSRIVRELTSLAKDAGAEVFATYCESHTTDLPFHAAAGLLRSTTGLRRSGRRGRTRSRCAARFPGADDEDLLLLDDLLGIGDPDVALPQIDPDARRRRLAAMVKAAALARTTPTVYVIEDAHWIDEISESMLAEFLTVIPQTPSLVVVTYRPEYDGALAHAPRSQTIALEPLDESQMLALGAELLGEDRSVTELAELIAERAAGNPFFAEEIVRDLSERDVLVGGRGCYLCIDPVADVHVPSTLQAVIAARIDRLDPAAKRTLNAAAVIGSRFTPDMLQALGIEAALGDLVSAELIDQTAFDPQPEYAFRHPLVRAVAYESQLKSDRAQLHRRVAAAIEQHDQNAALIAEHLEAAGDLPAAYEWHMRAGAWSTNRDIAAAQLSWERALQVADALPADAPNRMAMRIAPRTLICGNTWKRFHPDISSRFQELRDLCTQAGDKASLAVGMAGMTVEHVLHGRVRDASRAGVGVHGVGGVDRRPGVDGRAVIRGHSGKARDGRDDGSFAMDPSRYRPCGRRFRSRARSSFDSPRATALAWRGTARFRNGLPGWREDFEQAMAIAERSDTLSRSTILTYKYAGIPRGLFRADERVLREIEAAMKSVERSSDDMAVVLLRMTFAMALIHHGADRGRGYDGLRALRETCVKERFALNMLPLFETYLALERADQGEVDAAIQQWRAIAEEHGTRWRHEQPRSPAHVHGGTAAVAGRLRRSRPRDRAAGVVGCGTRMGLARVSALRLRVLLAQARGDETAYRDLRDRYRAMANDLGFEGHMAWAAEMP